MHSLRLFSGALPINLIAVWLGYELYVLAMFYVQYQERNSIWIKGISVYDVTRGRRTVPCVCTKKIFCVGLEDILHLGKFVLK